MASVDDEACPIAKKRKMDPSTSADSVQSLNNSFPKIDNLEYFPEKVLHHMFSKLDDTGLLNVAITSYRFEGIAKIVFKEKYANEYFVFDSDTDSAREMYEELFIRFGRYADIKAIKVKYIRNIDSDNHWLPKLLRQYTNELLKLAIDECTFYDINHFLQQHMHVTHLSFQSVYQLTILPDYRNLIKLELIYCGRDGIFSLPKTVRENRALESLILRSSGQFDVSEMLIVIAEHSIHLKELNLKSCGLVSRLQIPADVMDALVESLKQLESFALDMSSGNNDLELMQRLGLECKNLRQLEVGCSNIGGNISDEYFEAIRRFETLERLTISKGAYDNRIESLVESLPNLSHLRLSIEIPDTSILSLLRKCPSLETVTVDYYSSGVPNFFLNPQFFNEFNAVMQQPHGRVKLIGRGQKVVGFVTKKEIVWRNVPLHWTECDPSYNLSGVNLLPLDASNAERRNPLDHVLDYLDVRSLSSLSIASKRSHQLVQNYVQRYAQRNGTFTITDEIRCDFRGLGAFAEHVRSLKVHILDSGIVSCLHFIRDHYPKLNKLCIRTGCSFRTKWYEFPQVRQMILNAPISTDCRRFNFYEFSRLNPDLETLELKTAVQFRELYDVQGVLQFRNLKKLVFKCNNTLDRNYAKLMFENSKTQLVSIEAN